MEREFIKEFYESEIKRKELFSAKKHLPFGVFGILGGIFTYYLHNMFFTFDIANYVLFFALGFFGLSLLYSLVFLFLLMFGPEYLALDGGPEHLKWRQQMENYYEGDEKKVYEKIIEEMEKQMSEITGHNASCNKRLSEYFHKAYRGLALSAFFALITAFPHFYLDLNKKYQESMSIKHSVLQSTNPPAIPPPIPIRTDQPPTPSMPPPPPPPTVLPAPGR